MFSDVLLTVDFDRTLTATDSTIPQRNLEAIEYFTSHGGAFTVNTGRSVPMSRGRLLPEVPVNAPLLLYNGSAAYDKATETLTQVYPIDLGIGILEQLQKRFPQLHVEVQAVDAHYLLHEDRGWEAYCENNGCIWKYADPKDIPGPFVKFAFYGQFHEPTVASMYQATEGELAAIEAAIGWMDKTYGSNKLRAARALQKTLGRKILVCVGDAENDLTMLEGADFAFCPADGVVADRFPNVCSCDDGAIADVIYKKIPEIPDFSLTMG